MRLNAVEALGLERSPSPAAVKVLASALFDGDDEVRFPASHRWNDFMGKPKR